MNNFLDNYGTVLFFSILLLWGIIHLVIVLYNNDNERLSLWLDFSKFFLGTFVIGLLGYFAKISYDKRNLAILESDQIGKYVEQALNDDIIQRIRFAEYFNTVLPHEDRTANWDKYLAKLLKEQKEADSISQNPSAFQDFNQLLNSLESNNNEESRRMNQQQMEILLKRIALEKTIIDRASAINVSSVRQSSFIANPITDFITCKDVINNQPINPSTEFERNSRVFVFARIIAPKNEWVTIEWKDYRNEVLENGSKHFLIGKNTNEGFPIFNERNGLVPGGYFVELYNSEGNLLGSKDFKIK